MNRTNKILSIITVFLLSLALLMSVVDFWCFNKSFYTMEYQKNDTSVYTGMSSEDNLNATVTLLDYLKDRRDDILVTAKVNGVEREIYNERETLHMVDVKKLYQKALLVRNITLILGIALLIYLMVSAKCSLKQILRQGFVKGNLLIGGIVLFVAIWALADFDAFWTNFHLLFFDNDLWLLDPRTSIMINLFPGSFFFDLVIRIILLYVGILIAVGIYTALPERKHA